ncbi:MAG: Phosphatidylglycerophosphate synthase PgsA [Candidatus Methanohalarchaeum thermophilum]|uniref:Phosphatidylglycerophosphate synthase PgsA n=1 Tax=Methanohalarchaeum thermophilum TaxID=1903181 RepID=A0A1Q6DWW9_METT1|nr:MAG: Phosphatidylglycerophosphate synthase PgsA [Candidatus Methanohalarchaeum thermophilum]
MSSKIKKLLNLPNLITASRIPLAFLILFYIESSIKLPLFFILVATDGLDGYIARKYDMKTNFGSIFDPIVDKVVLVILLFGFVHYMIEYGDTQGLTYDYLLIFFAKDIFIVILALLSLYTGIPELSKIKSRIPGKIVINLQFIVLFALVINASLLAEAILWLILIASILAISDYLSYIAKNCEKYPNWMKKIKLNLLITSITFLILARITLWTELRSFISAIL